MQIGVLLNKMLVFLVLMGLGYVGARKKLLTPEFTKGASWLTMNVFLAATILNSAFTSTEGLTLAETGKVLLVFTCAELLCYAVGFLATKLCRVRGERAPVFELLIAVLNSIYVGLPVVQLLYGAKAVIYMAISCLPFNFVLFSYGVWRLQGGGKSSLNWRAILSTPMVVTLLSLPLFLFRVPVPAAVRELTGTLSGGTVPLSMVVIGSSLGRVRILDAFREKSLYLASLFRLIAAPLLAWPLLILLTGDEILRATALVFCACPSGVLVSILAIQYGRDVEYASKGVLLSTALSMLTIPLLVALLL